jgi:dynein light intermediate chain
MAQRSDPPDSLVKFDPALFVGFEPAVTENSIISRKGNDPAVSQLDDMVNSMLPPREWTQESGTWMQYVSKEPATRHGVIMLQEVLDKRLVERQAREAGICPVREDLYNQCFDEIIRQVTLDGPERGLLLLRVRDEIRMTIDAYKILVSLINTQLESMYFVTRYKSLSTIFSTRAASHLVSASNSKQSKVAQSSNNQ